MEDEVPCLSKKPRKSGSPSDKTSTIPKEPKEPKKLKPGKAVREELVTNTVEEKPKTSRKTLKKATKDRTELIQNETIDVVDVGELMKTMDEQRKGTMINKMGYLIKKKYFDEEELKRIRNELTVKPHVIEGYGKEEEPFPVFLENDSKLCLPRFYALEMFGLPERIEWNTIEHVDMKFKGSLRDYQEEIVKQATEQLTRHNKEHIVGGGCIISIPPGKGKTCIGIYLASLLKKKTLIIVHQQFLMDQWMERIHQFIENPDVGFIRGKIKDINHHIVIGMLQSISMKDYPDDFFNSFGTVIVDECHHISSRRFSEALPKINSPYTIGLSATPKRTDGLTHVFKWYLGNKVINMPETSTAAHSSTEVNIYSFECKSKNFKTRTNWHGKPNIAKMDTLLCEIEIRNKFIVDRCLELVKNPERKIIVLSSRIEHLNKLVELLQVHNFHNVGYYIGGMKKADLKKSEENQIIMASYAMASEGLDIPKLNTLILATSKSNIEQSIGRIQRNLKNEGINPLVIDIADQVFPFDTQALKRQRFYKSKKYAIKAHYVKATNTGDAYTMTDEVFDIEDSPTQDILPSDDVFLD
jgi:superfamily II DNA or RNA helicase